MVYIGKKFVFLNPIPTGLGHVTLIYGLIPPMAGRNRVKGSKRQKTEFSCDTCKKFYAFRQGLMRHISNVHERRKLFRCDSCDYTFGAKQSLDQHISSVHEKNTFSCSNCNEEFTRKHIRSKHEKNCK